MTEKTSAQDLLEEGAISIREAVEWSGIGKTRLYDAMNNGRLPYIRMGSRRLIPRKGLLRLLEEGLVDE